MHRTTPQVGRRGYCVFRPAKSVTSPCDGADLPVVYLYCCVLLCTLLERCGQAMTEVPSRHTSREGGLWETHPTPWSSLGE
jgi:hypothetical protein